MFEFFDLVKNIFSTAVDFIVNSVHNLLIAIGMIYDGVISVSLVIVYLPDVVGTLGLVIISYCVIVNLINKGG